MKTQLTAEEKSKLLQGTNMMQTNASEKAGIKQIQMADGPIGLRLNKSTAFPTSINIASGWNEKNAYEMGKSIAEECRYYGVNMLLGPGVNIKRNSLCGRNFEYYSEDPLLAGKLGANFVQGVQSQGVGATVKHYALNNQENFRVVSDSIADERAMREIYLKPFEIVIKEGNPSAVMTSYNKVNGAYASENKMLISDVLRGNWKYDGLVMSDWGGTDDRVESVKVGVDLEMPGDTLYNVERLKNAIESGEIIEQADKSVERLKKTAEKIVKEKTETCDFSKHSELCTEIATDCAVLLKNDGILPLDKKEKLCIIGEGFIKNRYQGSGSSLIDSYVLITHKDAFKVRNVEYEYAKGYDMINPKTDKKLIAEGIEKAKNYEKVIVFIGPSDYVESEGYDRESMKLAQNQTDLVNALLEQGKKVVCVFFGGSPVELPFADKVNAILCMYLPGETFGESTARILFGEKNPNGKLAETWAKNYSDVPYGNEYAKSINELYKESIYVGYRYYYTAGVETRYEFGYGLSYNEYEYSDLKTDKDIDGKVTVSLTVKNKGNMQGGEIVQLYAKLPGSKVFRAGKELRGFTKVYLEPGESKRVSISFNLSDLAFYNVKTSSFTVEKGEYVIEVGASSKDIRLTDKILVDGIETCPYETEINQMMTGAKLITNEQFEKLLGKPLPYEPLKKPLTMNSKIIDYKSKLFGKMIYKLLTSFARAEKKKANKLPEGPEKDNALKNAYFYKKIGDVNNLRILVNTSSGRLPYHVARGLVEIANGHLIKGIKYATGKTKPEYDKKS